MSVPHEPNIGRPKKQNSAKSFFPGRWKTIQKKALKPVAIEVGMLVFAWNTLQEGLCELFANLSDDRSSSDSRNVAYAVWHSAPNDRPQREMLRCAVAAIKSDDPSTLKLCEGISWTLEKLQALAGRRNDAIHTPLIVVLLSREDLSTEIEPLCRSGNPKSRQLLDKPVQEEYRWCRDHLERLAWFVNELHLAWYFRERNFPWPDKPELPSRGHYQSHLKKQKTGSAKHPRRR